MGLQTKAVSGLTALESIYFKLSCFAVEPYNQCEGCNLLSEYETSVASFDYINMPLTHTI